MRSSAAQERRPIPHTKKLAAIALLCTAAAPIPAHEIDVMHYTARLHGIPLLDISFCLSLTPGAYEAGLTARTLGIAEFLAHGRAAGHVEGVIDGPAVKPRTYAEHGRLAGENHAVTIAYESGRPIATMTPPQTKYRLPIPPADLPGAIDGLSAIALETLTVTSTGACQGSALVFDGLQLRRADTITAGNETLPTSPHSLFAGPAQRCDTTSTQLAGYLKSDPVKPQARPRHSRAWLARLAPGGATIPVRFAFDADALGDIVVDIDAVGHTRTAVCDGKDAVLF